MASRLGAVHKPGKPFAKGVSGNPKGRPKEAGEIRDLARRHTPEAFQTVVALMKSAKTPPGTRLAAAQILIERGYGKPVQQVEIDATVRNMTDDQVDARLAALLGGADGDLLADVLEAAGSAGAARGTGTTH